MRITTDDGRHWEGAPEAIVQEMAQSDFRARGGPDEFISTRVALLVAAGFAVPPVPPGPDRARRFLAALVEAGIAKEV